MAAGEQPIRDLIAEEVRRRIVLGELRPGERILEEDIAARHGVSRVPVREAIRRLEAEGYVQTVPFQGASVAVPSRRTALELMQIRRPLEALAARLAAECNGGALAPQLRQVTKSGVRAAERQERHNHPELVDEFHALVARMTGSVQLEELLNQLRSKVRWMFAVDLDHRATQAWHDHEEILGAILAGDADKAAQLMDEHVAADERWYLAEVPGSAGGAARI